MTDRYSNLTREIPMDKKTASIVASSLHDYWIMPYGIQNFVLSDNGPQCVAKSFESVCR